MGSDQKTKAPGLLAEVLEQKKKKIMHSDWPVKRLSLQPVSRNDTMSNQYENRNPNGHNPLYMQPENVRPRTELPGGWYRGGMNNQGPYLQGVGTNGDTPIRIKGSVADQLIEDITSFLTKGAAYASYGLVHKRGILIYGPPGTGKSTVARQIADSFVEGGGLVFPCSEASVFESSAHIRALLEPERPALFMMEDLENWVDEPPILNILDGSTQMKNVIFLGMTNHIENLPERIINRPGRFDRVEKIDHIPEAVQIEFLQRIEARVPGIEFARVIVEGLSGLAVTPAHLREAFASHVLMGIPMAELRARYEKMIVMYKVNSK